jgi:hypothetical protein
MADEQEDGSQAAWYEAAMTVVAAFLEPDPVVQRRLWAAAADLTVAFIAQQDGLGNGEDLDRLRAELSTPDPGRARDIAMETAYSLLESRRQHGIRSLDDIHPPDQLAFIRGTLIARGDEEGLAKIDRMVVVERFLDGLEAGEAAAS